jgi:hypothetical protein
MEAAAERDRRDDDGENNDHAHSVCPSNLALAPELKTRDFPHLSASRLEKR